MKKLLTTILSACLLAASLSAQAQTNSGSILGTIEAFFANNPTNSWETSVYGLNNITQSKLSLADGWGGGARIGYWLTRSVGANLDVSYCDSSWTFASLGLAGRGTINLGTLGSVTPYITAGPGWNAKTKDGVTTQKAVVVAGGGATLDLKAIKWCSFFAEYDHVTTSPDPQNRIIFGITKRF